MLATSMIENTRLDNGLRVITERMSHVRSASIGVWVENGSRHEAEAVNGISHFIEHAVFKGTSRRSARAIAEESDRQGGHLNASTGHENTCFHTRVLDEHLPEALDLIADLVTAPAFLPHELERERAVVVEEIKMVEDTPDELIQDIFSEHYWPGHPLGRPIAGSVETVSTFMPEVVSAYFRAHYTGSSTLLTAAGNLDHAEVVALAERLFRDLPVADAIGADAAPPATPALVLEHKDGLEQAHVLLGSPCPSVASPDRYAASLMSSILGDGMSSRLFQRIREERGLVYGIYSSIEAFADTGIHEIAASCSPEHVEEVVELVVEELRRLRVEGPTEEELRVAKEGIKVGTVLSLESTFNRMTRLARNELSFGRQIDLDEVLREINAVTLEDVVRVAEDICRGDLLALTVLGDVEGLALDRSMLVS
jgi:predicted Zn-dependent peptidase